MKEENILLHYYDREELTDSARSIKKVRIPQSSKTHIITQRKFNQTTNKNSEDGKSEQEHGLVTMSVTETATKKN